MVILTTTQEIAANNSIFHFRNGKLIYEVIEVGKYSFRDGTFYNSSEQFVHLYLLHAINEFMSLLKGLLDDARGSS